MNIKDYIETKVREVSQEANLIPEFKELRAVVKRGGQRVVRFKYGAKNKVEIGFFLPSSVLDGKFMWKERSSNTNGYFKTTDRLEDIDLVMKALKEL